MKYTDEDVKLAKRALRVVDILIPIINGEIRHEEPAVMSSVMGTVTANTMASIIALMKPIPGLTWEQTTDDYLNDWWEAVREAIVKGRRERRDIAEHFLREDQLVAEIKGGSNEAQR